jgi:hypothetical protein
MEAGLRNLASAAQELRNATETAGGAGKRFGNQVAEALQIVERNLTGAAERAGTRLEEPLHRLRRVLRPLTWLGAALGLLLATDVLLRWFR